MNIRKTLLLTLIVAIALLGLTLTGCEKKSDHPTGDHPTTTDKAVCPKCSEVVGSEACCMTKAAKEAAEKAGETVEKAAEKTEEVVKDATEAVKDAAAEHPAAEHPK